MEDTVSERQQQQPTRRPLAIQFRYLALVSALVLALIANLAFGGVAIPFSDVISALMSNFVDHDAPDRFTLVVNHIRLPRALAAMLVGASLAITGAMLQGLFRNPLADPGLVGVSAGAALAAVATIVFAHELSKWIVIDKMQYVLPVAAFLGGFLCTLLIYRISKRDGHTNVATMLLAGIAINAIALSMIGTLTYLSDDEQLRDVVFWQLGSLGGVSWSLLLPTIPLLVIPLLILKWASGPLNALALGEDDAGNLGVNVTALTYLIILAVAIGVGAAVAISGIIGFVGLIVPHLIRLISGVNHRHLLPQSALLGSCLLLLADLTSRTIVVPAELPIGLVTSAFGGPFFLWLLVRNRKRLAT